MTQYQGIEYKSIEYLVVIFHATREDYIKRHVRKKMWRVIKIECTNQKNDLFTDMIKQKGFIKHLKFVLAALLTSMIN